MKATEKDPVITFDEIKAELLCRMKEAYGGAYRYIIASATKTLAGLMQVVKDNFLWACANKVITSDIIEKYREEFASCDIYLNVDVKDRSFLLCTGNAKVNARDNATAVACDNASVTICDNATAIAYDNASVRAHDVATVFAYDNSTSVVCNNVKVKTFNNATVKAYNTAVVEARGTSNILACGQALVTAHNKASVKAYDIAIVEVMDDDVTIEASDNAYCFSLFTVKCKPKLYGHAIYRNRQENVIYYADGSMTFKQQN